jgi:hypothetical protein
VRVDEDAVRVVEGMVEVVEVVMRGGRMRSDGQVLKKTVKSTQIVFWYGRK